MVLAVVLIAYTCKGAAALAAFQRLTPLVARRRWRYFSLHIPVKAGRHNGGISETYTPSGATALAVVLIAYTCKGAAALAEVQRLTPLVARRRWR